MWTEITRPQYLRKGLRYASDVTEAEWHVIEPQLPAPKLLGRPGKTELIAMVNALFYIASALDQTEGTGSRLSLARMASAGLVQTKGLGWSLCALR